MSTQFKVILTKEQRSGLEKLIRTGSAPARTQTRARILLLADRGIGRKLTDQQIAQAMLISAATVAAVRHRFVAEGLEAALYEKPRPGRSPKITGDVEEKLARLAGSDPPIGHKRWSLRLLADALVAMEQIDSISHVAVAKALRKHRNGDARDRPAAGQPM